jgi:uncharacterized protein (TIGR00299 family) protein
MKTLFLDCQAGIAGDMTVAALIDLGVPLTMLQEELAKLPLPAGSYQLATEPVKRGGIAATLLTVTCGQDQPHRHYTEICRLISASGLAPAVQETAGRIFECLAQAEAKVHGVPVDAVHFHEVGAIDAIVDIVGVAIALDWLGIDEVYAAPLPLGSGWVETAHGRLPVPAPATLELLRGLPVHTQCGAGERVTPTGAAIVAALTTRGQMPLFQVQSVGYGAGSRQYDDTPNLLRAVAGTREVATDRDEVVVLETHVDDLSAEVLGYAMERLLAAGALDVAYAPLQMKKNRPGVRVTVIARPEQAEELARLVLRETTALGVRLQPLQRMVRERLEAVRETSLGPVRVKVVQEQGQVLRVVPEYEECRRLALSLQQPLLAISRQLERELAEQ